MNALLIPPKNFFTVYRLLLWFAFGNVGFREGYEDISTWNTYERKLNPVEGRHRWLAVMIISTEVLICYKYREGTGTLENNPTPIYVWLPWSIIFVVFTSCWLYLRFKPGGTVKYLEEPPHVTKQDSKKIK